MKLKYKRIEEGYFDLEIEKARLKRCFKGNQLKRQLALIGFVEKEEWKKFEKAYDDLPRCKKQECPEQEYTHPDLTQIVFRIIYHAEHESLSDYGFLSSEGYNGIKKKIINTVWTEKD